MMLQLSKELTVCKTVTNNRLGYAYVLLQLFEARKYQLETEKRRIIK